MLQDMSKFFAPVTDNLASSIRTLDDKLITSQMHTVRVIGNIAAHDEHPLTAKDVLPALFAMLRALEWWHETA